MDDVLPLFMSASYSDCLWGREVAGYSIGVVKSVGSTFMLFISSFLNI
jgi:hypothetical protein